MLCSQFFAFPCNKVRVVSLGEAGLIKSIRLSVVFLIVGGVLLPETFLR